MLLSVGKDLGGPLNLVGGDIDWQIFWKAIFCEIKNV